MADEILDLDAFVPPARTIKIDGKNYKVAGGGSVELTLKLIAVSKAQKENPQSEAALKVFMETLQKFFIDSIEMDKLMKLDLVTQIPMIVAFLYGRDIKKLQDENVSKKAEGQPKT